MPHGLHFPLMPRIFMAVRRESRFRFQRSWRRRRRYPIWRNGHLPAQP
ncbi:hypothetical protein BZL30_9434 [Mycobacterium kansasii]|uniref:Uncharacterized protein n=1 Tax=Mycobacterium kansasii TaxID=1768 RepID=A0A1V3W9R9_MYCKA|nr:hypothetical protein BZL30_9434 [Mycobacterium kansasii]